LIIFRPIEPYLNSRGLTVRHGLIADLSENANLSRNTIKKYLRGEAVEKVNLTNLSDVIDELVRVYPKLDATSMLAYCLVWSTFISHISASSLTTYVGAVSHERFDWSMLDSRSADVSVSLNDGKTAGLLESVSLPETERVPIPFQRDLASRTKKIDDADKEYVRNLFADRARRIDSIRNHTDLFLASSKANLASEIFVANALGLAAFDSADSDRLPFGYVPRDTDFAASCFAVSDSGLQPGLVWRGADGKWKHLGYEQGTMGVTQDAGLVFVRYDQESRYAEALAFGFSGFGTRALGDALVSEYQIPWPPKTKHDGCLVDLFAYKFTLHDDQLAIEGPHRMPSELLAAYL